MKIEMLFGVVAVLVVVFAAAVFGTQYVTPVTTSVAPVQTTETTPTYVTVTVSDDLDPETEMQYIYVQSQNIVKMHYDFEELNEIQERMYDVAEDYDPVEYDMLQEQVDNERTIAKYVRDIVELPT